MRRNRQLCVMLSLLVLCWGAAAQAPLPIVSNGNPVGLDLDRSSAFDQGEGYIEQAGSVYLHPAYPINEDGDFTVVWDMSWEEPSVNGSHGHTIFAKPRGNNVAIFAGGTEFTFRLRYIEGATNEFLHDLGPFNDIVDTSERFTMAVKSQNGYWSYWVNGVKVADAEDYGYLFPGFDEGDTPAELGIRPWNNTVRIYNWHQYDYFVEDTDPVAAPQLGAPDDYVSLQEAEIALADAGLAVGNVSQQWHPTIPAGMIISQDPAPGSIMLPGSAVNVVVSLGPPIAAVPAAGPIALIALFGLSVLGGVIVLRRFARS